MSRLFITIAVIIFIVLSALVPDIGKVNPSYTTDWSHIFGAMWTLIIPMVIGYSIGRSED